MFFGLIFYSDRPILVRQLERAIAMLKTLKVKFETAEFSLKTQPIVYSFFLFCVDMSNLKSSDFGYKLLY
ncbi:hypothetical protein CKA32_000037 [Geitlerinema sp. FC II]|nr:hypothetical protein CKA32_000037 [Geitlerinema sp. FC II]